MTSEVRTLVTRYLEWTQSMVSTRPISDGWIAITLPFLDHHNDYIQIYARTAQDRITLSDDSSVTHALEMAGVHLDKARRSRALLETEIQRFGAMLDDANAITIDAPISDLGSAINRMAQAMLAAEDRLLPATGVGPERRSDIVSSTDITELDFLAQASVWTPNQHMVRGAAAKLPGRSGVAHRFDAFIPASESAPARILEFLGRANPGRIMRFGASVFDVRAASTDEVRAFAFLNDMLRTPEDDIRLALESMQIHAVPWTQRERVYGELAA